MSEVSLTQHPLAPPTTLHYTTLFADVVSMCEGLEERQGGSRSPGHRKIPLSLLTAEGYDGQNCGISLHACLAVKNTERQK